MKQRGKLFTLLRLPELADPVERRAARLLQSTMIAGIAALALHVLVLLVSLGPDQAASQITTSLTSIMLGLGVLLILRQGHVRLAAQIAVFGIGFALSLGVYFGRGITGAGYSSFVILVTAAGLLLSTRTAFITAFMAVSFGTFLVTNEYLHGITPERFKNSVLSLAANAALFFASAGMVGFTVSRLKRDTELSLRNQESTRVAEEKLSLALDASNLGTWEWSVATGEIVWNQKTQQIFGVETRDFPGTFEAFLGRVHPDDRDALKAAIAEALTTPGAMYRVTHRAVRPSGEIFHFRAYGRVIRRDDGTPLRMVGTVADVTARIQEEEKEKSIESGFRDALTSLRTGVVIQGPDGRVIYINPAAVEMFGLRSTQSAEWLPEIQDVIREDGTPCPPETRPFSLAVRTRKPVLTSVLGVYRPDLQDRVWIEIDAVPQTRPDGEIEQVICTFVNVTARIQARKAAAIDSERYARLLETESRYSEIFKHAADPILLIGADGLFTDANPAACALLDCTREELLKMGPASIIAPESLAERPLRLEGIGRDPFIVNRTIMRKDGTRVSVEARVRRINDRALIAVLRDMSVHVQGTREIEQLQQRYQSMVEASPDGVAVHQNGIVVYANREMVRILGGQDSRELVGQPVMRFVGQRHAELVRERIESVLEKGQTAPMMQEQFVRLDGTMVDVEVGGSPVLFNGAPAVQAVVRDLSRTRRAELILHHSEERWKLIAENVPDFILLLDDSGHILFLNHLIPGWKKEDVIGQSVTRFQPPDWHERVLDMVNRVFRDGASFEYESPGAGAPGEERTYVTRLVPIRDPDGGVASALMIATDITARKRDVARLEYQATHDSLTDLPNRQSLIEKSLNAIETAERTGKQCALLLIDLDRFKEINDTLGHYTGDLLLKRIGPRLHSFLKTTNAELARLGGDEFAILVPSINEAAEVEGIAQSVHHLIREPFQLEGMNLELDSSIGIALYPLHGRDPIALLRCADVAMYIAKKRATGTALYSPEQDRYSRRRLSLLTELGLAIREDQLHIEYQPKFQLPGKKGVGLEALVRWTHPQHGPVSPGEFIPLAEMGNLIIPLTHWVLDTVLRQIQAWSAQGLEIKVAVNLSVRSLMDEHWPITVDAMLRHYRIKRNLLEFEITESAIMADPERALVVLNRLHSLGITLSIDDFGTGYSSLSYLSRLPIDALKIDRSFVMQMRENERNTVIVNSTIRLAHTLGIHVIAEGVEEAETLSTLVDMKCDQAQGYLLARPAKAPQAVEFFKT